MNSIARDDIVIGVDTHKDTHVAFACDGLGGRVDDIDIPAPNDGYSEFLDWAVAMGNVIAFGVEGTGSFGIGLARFLRRHGQRVVEVSRPPRAGQRRLSGKSDVIDAEHAARAVLAGTAAAVPELADGQVEAIRLLKVVHDTAVKAHKTAMITLKATLLTAGDDLRSELVALTDHKLILACAALSVPADLADRNAAMRHTLNSFARRWLDLHEEIKLHTRHLKALTKAAAPLMLEAFGVGFDTAAEMLLAAGTTPTGSAPRQHSRSSAASARSLPGPAARTDAIDSTAAATA